MLKGTSPFLPTRLKQKSFESGLPSVYGTSDADLLITRAVTSMSLHVAASLDISSVINRPRLSILLRSAEDATAHPRQTKAIPLSILLRDFNGACLGRDVTATRGVRASRLFWTDKVTWSGSDMVEIAAPKRPLGRDEHPTALSRADFRCPYMGPIRNGAIRTEKSAIPVRHGSRQELVEPSRLQTS